MEIQEFVVILHWHIDVFTDGFSHIWHISQIWFSCTRFVEYVHETKLLWRAPLEVFHIFSYVSFQFFVSRLWPFLTPRKQPMKKKVQFFWRISLNFYLFDAFLSIFVFLKRVLGEMRQNKRVLGEMRQKNFSHFYGLFLGGQK